MRNRSTRIAIAVGAAILLCIVLSTIMQGCSPSQRIAEGANVARANAAASEQRFVVIDERALQAQSALGEIRDEAAGGIREQQAIVTAAERIAEAVPGVQDRPNEWLGTLTWLAIAAVAVALVVLVWQLGVGTLVRTAIGWLPQRKVAAAKLLDEAGSDYSETTLDEAVAAMRGMDPEFDAAWRRRRLRDGLR
jgi:hypothetical protein